MPTNQQVYDSAVLYTTIIKKKKQLKNLNEQSSVIWYDDKTALKHYKEQNSVLGEMVGTFGITFIICFCILLVIFSTLNVDFVNFFENSFLNEFIENCGIEDIRLKGLIHLVIISLVIPIIIVTIIGCITKKDEKEFMNSYAVKRKDALDQKPYISSEISNLKIEIADLESKFNRENVIHEKYLPVCGTLWGYIEQGRAYDLHDAIAIYEQEKHRRKQQQAYVDMIDSIYDAREEMEDYERRRTEAVEEIKDDLHWRYW